MWDVKVCSVQPDTVTPLHLLLEPHVGPTTAAKRLVTTTRKASLPSAVCWHLFCFFGFCCPCPTAKPGGMGNRQVTWGMVMCSFLRATGTVSVHLCIVSLQMFLTEAFFPPRVTGACLVTTITSKIYRANARHLTNDERLGGL